MAKKSTKTNSINSQKEGQSIAKEDHNRTAVNENQGNGLLLQYVMY